MIGELQRELRRKALAHGQQLYSETTELFRKHLAELWRPQRTRASRPSEPRPEGVVVND